MKNRTQTETGSTDRDLKRDDRKPGVADNLDVNYDERFGATYPTDTAIGSQTPGQEKANVSNLNTRRDQEEEKLPSDPIDL